MLVEFGIADHIWLDKRESIAQTVDALGDEFKPAMRAGWMSYIRKVYPDGPADGGHAIGQGPLILDGWVLAARGLFTHWYPVVDVPVGQFSAMSMHPNLIFDFWYNVYYSTNNWYNSDIRRIIGLNQHGLGSCGSDASCPLDLTA